jgi:RHS repeat-associated protein
MLSDKPSSKRQKACQRCEIDAANGSTAVYATNVVQVVNGGVTTATEVVTFVPEAPEVREYDADGNLTRDGRWVYTWTAENRLRKMETRDDLPAGVPNLTLEFKYDHLGRRIQKVVKVDDTTVLDRRYAWMGRQLLWEVNSAGSVVKGYEWGPDLSQTMEGAGTVGGLLRVTDHGGAWESWLAFPCYDGNGNVMGLAGYATGNILAQYEYDPYGRLIRITGDPALAAANPFRFSTKFQDEETGLSEYGYRYYDPESGRWLNRDPIGESGGNNLYGFARNDAIGRIDALGLSSLRNTMLWYFIKASHLYWGFPYPSPRPPTFRAIDKEGEIMSDPYVRQSHQAFYEKKARDVCKTPEGRAGGWVRLGFKDVNLSDANGEKSIRFSNDRDPFSVAWFLGSAYDVRVSGTLVAKCHKKGFKVRGVAARGVWKDELDALPFKIFAQNGEKSIEDETDNKVAIILEGLWDILGDKILLTEYKIHIHYDASLPGFTVKR